MASAHDRVRELFVLPLEEFTAARNRLAKELRDEGDREGADRAGKARKPTVAAWALNRAAREEPALVEAMLKASDRLRDVQSRGARSADLKGASTARRRAVEHVADAAKQVLGGGAGAHEADITQTLLAAATDQEVRERLRSGTLERAATASANFEDLGSLLAASVESAPRGRTKARTEEGAPPVDRQAVERARARAEKLDAEATEAEENAARQEEDAEGAERDAERLRREAEKARRSAEEARKRATRARDHAEKTRSKADDAVTALAELEGSSS
jgi:hypothetical protein